MSAIAAATARLRRTRLPFARSISVRIWLALGLLLLGVAMFGPFFAPYGPSELAGIPLTRPDGEFLLGTDQLGRDVLSRVLWGGRSIIGLAVASTLIAYAVGGAIGLVAGHSKGLVDAGLMRFVDVLLAFPPLLFLLLLSFGVGAGPWTIVAGVAAINVPGIARIVRTAALEVSVRGYVEAAVARGERMGSVLVREIAPNIAGTIVADGGVRFTGSFLAIAGLNFLGLGLQPPAADWATIIAENRTTIGIQPWAVAAPAILIALFTVAVNVVADAIARTQGRSTAEEEA
jgi:ABC-type dipeptide/oligopeptide/nickel transport system permease subunit